MKGLIKLLVLLLIPVISLSQNISDAKTLKNAAKISAISGKPLLILIEANNKNPALNTAKKNLRSPEVLEKMKNSFTVFETVISDPSIAYIRKKYNINIEPTFIFMFDEKEAFLKESGYSPLTSTYLEILDNALFKKKRQSMDDLEKSFLSNQNNTEPLEKFIQARMDVGITDNAELIEKYVQKIDPLRLNDEKVIQFILEAGPYAEGNAFKTAFSNKRLVNSAYKSGKSFVKIRASITDNSLRKAIKTKDINLAKAAASYVRDLAGKFGHINYNSSMLSYYKGVGDTASFLKTAIPFYDDNYMSLSAATIIEKQESYVNSEILKSTKLPSSTVSKVKKDSIEISTIGKGKITISKTAIPVKNSGLYANILNSAAWSFYQTGTKNAIYLTKAMLWSRRSIELEPNAAYYDTLAHLLYKLGYETEAIKTQKDAIARANFQGISVSNMRDELKKMKNKTL